MLGNVQTCKNIYRDVKTTWKSTSLALQNVFFFLMVRFWQLHWFHHVRLRLEEWRQENLQHQEDFLHCLGDFDPKHRGSFGNSLIPPRWTFDTLKIFEIFWNGLSMIGLDELGWFSQLLVTLGSWVFLFLHDPVGQPMLLLEPAQRASARV